MEISIANVSLRLTVWHDFELGALYLRPQIPQPEKETKMMTYFFNELPDARVVKCPRHMCYSEKGEGVLRG